MPVLVGGQLDVLQLADISFMYVVLKIKKRWERGVRSEERSGERGCSFVTVVGVMGAVSRGRL